MLEAFVGNFPVSPPPNIKMYEVSLEGDYPRAWEVGWHVSSEAHSRACVEESEGLLWSQGSDLSWGFSVGKVVLGPQTVEVIAQGHHHYLP